MPAFARKLIFDAANVGAYHCIARCVRRAFLCGFDRTSGRSFEHRREWLRRRLELLAGAFGLDVLGFAVLANHLHVVLRNRPDVVTGWSDDEIARRWWRLCPTRRNGDGSPAEPTDADLGFILGDARRTAELRARLSSISWFMRLLCEPLAKLANREDQCTGHFWEGRFKSQALLDETAILACAVYVDLNPIRAGLAETPEASDFTSVQERIAAFVPVSEPVEAELAMPALAAPKPATAHFAAAQVDSNVPHAGDATTNASPQTARRTTETPPRLRPADPSDGWLSPVSLSDQPGWLPASTSSESGSPSKRRASDRGFLPLSLAEYLTLVDWTGRQLRRGKRGAIAADAPPILQRLGLSGESWLWGIESFGRLFRSAVGRATALSEFAASRGRRWLHGVSAARIAFG